MKSVRIIDQEGYTVDSYGNGWAYKVTRKHDGASAWFQDDDASYLRAEMDGANEGWTYADIFGQYDSLFEVEGTEGFDHA